MVVIRHVEYCISQKLLHRVVHCHVGITIHWTRAILTSSNEQYPAKATTCHILFVYCLTRWSLLMMNNALVVKDNCQVSSYYFDSFVLSSVSERLRSSTAKTESWFWDLAIYPQFVTCYDCFQKVFVVFDTIKEFLHS